MKKWDEKLADLSTDLVRLSEKAADTSVDVKTASELKEESIDDRISKARGHVAAFQERIRTASDEKKSKLSSSLLKAQTTIEEKRRQRREKKDRRLLETYIDDQISYIYENIETASYLISSVQLAVLETVAAIDEYNTKYAATTGEAEALAEDITTEEKV